MTMSWLTLIILALGVVGYFLGRQRAMASAGGDIRNLHSLPVYYGANVLFGTVIPSIVFIVVLSIALPSFVGSRVSGTVPESEIAEGSSLSLVLAEVKRVANGLDNAVRGGHMTEAMATDALADLTDVTDRLNDAGQILTTKVTPEVLKAAQAYRSIYAGGKTFLTIWALIIAVAGFVFSYMRTNHEFRARNVVENGILILLILAASVAIMTTIGIVLSLIFNTIEFFRLYPITDFFFGLTWSPSFSGRGGSSELGIIPLIWGTLYISSSHCWWLCPSGCLPRSICRNMPRPRCERLPNPRWRFWRGSPPSSTASSRC